MVIFRSEYDVYVLLMIMIIIDNNNLLTYIAPNHTVFQRFT